MERARGTSRVFLFPPGNSSNLHDYLSSFSRKGAKIGANKPLPSISWCGKHV